MATSQLTVTGLNSLFVNCTVTTSFLPSLSYDVTFADTSANASITLSAAIQMPPRTVTGNRLFISGKWAGAQLRQLWPRS